jgi:hypothetical protein
MKRLLFSLLALTVIAGAVLGLQTPVSALGGDGVSALQTVASSKADVCNGIGLAGGSCGDKGAGLTKVVKAVIDILSLIVGVAAVIMIILGGFKYITSGGDTAGVASAKNTVIYAIVGLVIVAMAQTIVYFVLNKTS